MLLSFLLFFRSLKLLLKNYCSLCMCCIICASLERRLSDYLYILLLIHYYYASASLVSRRVRSLSVRTYMTNCKTRCVCLAKKVACFICACRISAHGGGGGLTTGWQLNDGWQRVSESSLYSTLLILGTWYIFMYPKVYQVPGKIDHLAHVSYCVIYTIHYLPLLVHTRTGSNTLLAGDKICHRFCSVPRTGVRF